MDRREIQRPRLSHEEPPQLSTFGLSAMKMGFHTDARLIPSPEAEETRQATTVVQIQQETERLRQELDYYKSLVTTVLLPLLPQLEDFADRLLSATSNFDIHYT